MESQKDNYFKDLREQIMNEEKWVEDKFVVFGYKAGSGKSSNSFRFIAEMAKEKSHRVLYVQKFVRDEEMDNTVATINLHAGKRIAEGFHSKMGERAKKEVIKAQIMCISHQMYLQICKGNRSELVKGRDVLIIDEYPDLVEKITLDQSDIGNLWMLSYGDFQLENLAHLLRKKRCECNSNGKRNIMEYIDFGEKEFEPFKKMLSGRTDKTAKIIGQPLLEKLQQILSNGCLFYEDAFHTYNNQLKLYPLKNNIILDANGEFDYRYRLSSQFIVKTQEAFYDYSPSKLQHFQIKTDKTSLKKQINLADKVFKKIALENKGETLIVTDKDNSDKVKTKVIEHLTSYGFNKGELENKVKIDHFGNLIGVNTYRNYETIIILKTPFYDYLSYALTYFYFLSMEKITIGNVEVYKNNVVEMLRESMVAGEIYQAMMRINRNNSHPALFVVCTDYQEAMDLVLEQLPNIQYENDILEINREMVKELPGNSTIVRLAKVKKFLLDQMEMGVKEVRKKDVKKLVSIADGGNFKRTILNNLAPFFKQHNIEITNNRIILNK